MQIVKNTTILFDPFFYVYRFFVKALTYTHIILPDKTPACITPNIG